MGRTRDTRKVIKVPAVRAGRHAPLTNRAAWRSQRSISSAHRPCERIEKAGWGVFVTREKKMQFPANRDGRPSPRRGRAVRPDILSGKACWAYASTVPVERSGIWDAHRGLDALVRRHPFSSIKFGFVNDLNLILSWYRGRVVTLWTLRGVLVPALVSCCSAYILEGSSFVGSSLTDMLA